MTVTARDLVVIPKLIRIAIEIADKYTMSIGESISVCIPEKKSLAMATNDELCLWLEFYFVNGRRIEL